MEPHALTYVTPLHLRRTTNLHIYFLFFNLPSVTGTILNMESVYTRTKPGKIYASATFWTEAPSKPRQYAFFIRIFFVVGLPERGEIGERLSNYYLYN